jgi:hemerythrin-like domain-containing protein
MNPIDILMQEHRVIEGVLDALESAANRLDRGEVVRPRFFVDAAEFIRDFADGCHHRKEEGVFFGAMVESGAPAEGGAIEMMLEEHEEGRRYTRAMRDAAVRLERGDGAACGEITANAKRYVALLRDHIAKEDEMLFPMAAELIPPAREEELLERFERLEADDAGNGAHERLVALAVKLAREAKA